MYPISYFLFPRLPPPSRGKTDAGLTTKPLPISNQASVRGCPAGQPEARNEWRVGSAGHPLLPLSPGRRPPLSPESAQCSTQGSAQEGQKVPEATGVVRSPFVLEDFPFPVAG